MTAQPIPESISLIAKPPHWKAERCTFYKFMTRSTGRIVLTNRTLRWSRPRLLNDPHDNQFLLLPGFDQQEAKLRGLEKLWETHYGDAAIDPRNALGRLIRANRSNFPHMPRAEFVATFGEAFDEVFASMDKTIARFNEDIQEQMATNKLLCLTERVDDTRMWAHYAEAHSGIALRFRAIPELDSMWGLAEPVRYQTKLPVLCDVEYFSDIMSGRRSLEIAEVLRDMVFVKSLDWQHEREWRIYGGSGWAPEQEFEDIGFNSAELDAAVLGCKMPAEDAAYFTEIIRRKYPSAALYSAVADRSSFTLSFEQLN